MDILKPEILHEISPQRKEAILKRSMVDVSSVYLETREIVMDIRERGDVVSIEHYRKYKDDISENDLLLSEEEIAQAYETIDRNIVEKLKFAAANIEKFHQFQVEQKMWSVEIMDGITVGRLVRPMDIVGAYVPGRKAIYPSSVLMTIIPAKVAGVDKIIACTPPDEGMVANKTTVIAADIAGAEQIFKLGGPWAVASMAYGTATIPKVDKIVGPGNKYVTAAKMLVFGQVDIDSPAGPSEVLILADETADARLTAIDILSQVEHDEDAAAVLVTTDEELANKVCKIVASELDDIPRREIITAALKRHSAVIVATDLQEAIDFTNEYASEHLQIVTKEPFSILPRIKHAGSIFLGQDAPVPVGDYASGTNHVLPTGQCARMFSGLSVDDFVKKPTFQYLTKDGLERLKDAVVTLAEAEGLYMHARAVRERFEEN
ncbi:TPA: histidinol dehydrogenase [Candidatus Poribacteria bacterium]|nr:histidinol dehydrogenase [Candidatus Poribacteria bacterium]